MKLQHCPFVVTAVILAFDTPKVVIGALRCPIILSKTVIGTCVEECTGRFDISSCTDGKFCCPGINGCGHVCVDPEFFDDDEQPDADEVIIDMDNAKCPPLSPDSVGICVEACNVETNHPCPPNKLCCSNGCGHVCMDPVFGNSEPDADEITESVCDYNPDGDCWSEESYNQCILLEESGCTGAEIIMTRSCPPLYRCRKIMFVGPEKAECEGVAPQLCYLVKFEGPDKNEWQYFYDEIIDFGWEEGYEYTISVSLMPLENPPADSSAIQYQLIEILSQSETTLYMPVVDPTQSACESFQGNACINKNNYEYCLALENNGCTSKDIQILESCPLQYRCEKTMYVASEMVNCIGLYPFQCYLIKFNTDDEWQYTYNDIVGFDYVEGIDYELIVFVEPFLTSKPGEPTGQYEVLSVLTCPSGYGITYSAFSTEECRRTLLNCNVGHEPFFGDEYYCCGCKPMFCGGIAGIQCPAGSICIDDPGDNCDPSNGGADCGGICQPIDEVCSTIPCSASRHCTQVNGCGEYKCDKRYDPGVEGYDGTCSLAETNYEEARCNKFIQRDGRGGLRRSKCE